MKILISGAGIAGPTLAYWLDHYGFTPILIESSPTLRAGGYIIDFWGAGFDVADRMGLMAEIRRKGYLVEEVRVVDRHGKRVGGFSVESVARIVQGRYISLPRGELAASIFSKIEGRVETIFGDRIRSIAATETGAGVTFESGAAREFDLVVGADGLHSRVRELVFGPETHFEKYLGYKVAAFETRGYPARDELVYVTYTQIGQQVARFTMRDDRTMFLFVFADENATLPANTQAQKALLKSRFGNSGWECPGILEALDAVDELYFDRVSQIRMNHHRLWSRGRVTLVGDAAFCISLLGGQGSALAMVAAYILAGELHRAQGNYPVAFARYQDLFGPFVLQKQEAALRFGGAFAPKSRAALFLRNQIFKLMGLPWVASLVLARGLSDKIAPPDYDGRNSSS